MLRRTQGLMPRYSAICRPLPPSGGLKTPSPLWVELFDFAHRFYCSVCRDRNLRPVRTFAYCTRAYTPGGRPCCRLPKADIRPRRAPYFLSLKRLSISYSAKFYRPAAPAYRGDNRTFCACRSPKNLFWYRQPPPLKPIGHGVFKLLCIHEVLFPLSESGGDVTPN